MCGIFGIVGQEEVQGRLLEGLSRLEYRGYDSAGVAIQNGSRNKIARAAGDLAALRSLLSDNPITGRVGLGHTRWATHGCATEVNAHPHRSGSVTLVHNGIIENHEVLWAELAGLGRNMASETDTEVVAHYLDHLLCRNDTMDSAFKALLSQLEGSYALGVLFDGYPDVAFVARAGSPLAIGIGRAPQSGLPEAFIGSDALALSGFADRIFHLEDGDWGILEPDRIQIFDRNGSSAKRSGVTVEAKTWTADKGSFRDFMLKEIHDQPASLARLATSLLDSRGRSLKPLPFDKDLSGAQRVVMVACGTAHYACQIAKYWFEHYAAIPVEVDIASEFRYRPRVLTGNDIVIVVSQSGETADTLAALKDVAGDALIRIAVVNVPSSSIAREADAVIDIKAGPEIGVASTKAFTGQMMALLVLSLHLAQAQGKLDPSELQDVAKTLGSLSGQVHETIEQADHVKAMAKEIFLARDAFFLGRGSLFPVALEAALKLKEISYIHAEGFAGGELKHGPLALIDADVPVVVFDNCDGLNEKTASNASEVHARGARVWHVGPLGAQAGEDHIWTPAKDSIGTVFCASVVAQLLAYYAAVEKGTNVDKPRNLAKSVTVE